MIHYLIIGTLLGLSAGLSPGPLLTLVISETLRHDVKAGIRVALAPLITDLPIILLALFVLARLGHMDAVLGLISLVGGAVLLYMGFHGIRIRDVDPDITDVRPRSLAKGILVNALSPHPYLFWITIGGPTGNKALTHGIGAFFAFFIGFYFCLVSSKVTLALITGKSKSFLQGNLYKNIMRLLGLALWALAVFLFIDGVKLLGWIS